MKILCVIDSLGAGGAQRQLTNLALGFKETGHDVSFLTYHPENFFQEQLDKVKIPIITIIEPTYLKRLFRMRKYIRNGNYDSLLSFLDAPSFICEFAGMPYRNWKLVVCERSADPKILKSFKLKFFRYMHLFADEVVSNSCTNLEMVKKVNPLLPENKCYTIYNMVDLDLWKPAENYIVRKNGKTNIVIAASHQYLKNSRNLIEALNLLTDAEKSVISIEWYGGTSTDNSYLESIDLINHYSLNDIIEFLPPINNIAEKVQAADCCALFSLYEGLPNTICEGMALGKPIIATKVSDMPKLIDEKIGGYLCDTSSAESIRDVIRKILSTSNEQLILMGNHNREKAKLLFEKNEILNKYLNIIVQ